MTCTNNCCGFIALSGMIGIGELTVSHGLGSCEFNPIVFPEDPYIGLQEGKGLETYLRAWAAEGPKAAIRFPEIDPELCDKPPSKADTFSGPKTMGMMEAPPEEVTGTAARSAARPAPKVSGTVSSSSRRSGTRTGAAVVRAPKVAGAAPAAPSVASRSSRQAVVQRPPKVSGEAPEAVEEEPGTEVTGTTKPGPKIKG